MPSFVAIGYGDRQGYDHTAEEIRDSAHGHDRHLQSLGATMGVAGSPVQVRNHDARRVITSDGAFMRSTLPLAGFTVVEAADVDEAVRMVSGTPCAVAHGVVEVWPLEQAG